MVGHKKRICKRLQYLIFCGCKKPIRIYYCFLFVLISTWSSVYAESPSEEEVPEYDPEMFFEKEVPLDGVKFFIEGTLSYYIPHNKILKRLHQPMPFYSFNFKMEVLKRLYPYLSGGYLFSRGLSIAGKKTDLYMIPCEFGVLFIPTPARTGPYVGIGVTSSYVHLNNDSRCGPSIQSAWAYGGVFKSGLFFLLSRNFFLDCFCEYYLFSKTEFTPVAKHLDSNKVELSGWNLGGGFGYSF